MKSLLETSGVRSQPARLARLARRARLFVVPFVVTGFVGCQPAGSNDDSTYANTTVEIVVPFREGGGSDSWARAIAPFLAQHLGDDVNVNVVNVLGASGLQGGNEFALRRPHDGLSLFVSSGSNSLPWLLGEQAVRYDFDDFLGVIGSPTGGVIYASAETGITSLADMCNALELYYGGISPTGLDMVPLVSFELLNLDLKAVLGYQGKGAARIAFEQGEVNIDYQTSSAYLRNVMPLVEEGSAIPLYTFGTLNADGEVVRDDVFPDIPSIAEAFTTCHGRPPAGDGWEAYKAILAAGFSAQKNLWVHNDAPSDRIDALLDAAAAVIADTAFLNFADRLVGGYPFYSGNAVDRAFGQSTRMPAAARAWLLELLRRKFDVAI